MDVAEILEKLIAIPSPSGEEARLGGFVEAWLRETGYRVARQEVEPGRFNLLALTTSKPRVLLSTHLDTVLPEIPIARQGEVVYGRGACDAKGSLAAMLVAASRLTAQGEKRFGLLFVVGEERDSDGARKAAELQIDSRYVILGEPTENRLASGQKGTLVFRLAAEGRAGHSALPEEGFSAVHELLRVTSAWLDKDWGTGSEMGATTLNIGIIQGGSGPNVIADCARAEGIFRVATGVDEICAAVQESLPSRVRFSVLSSSEPTALETVEGFETSVVAFGSDAPWLSALGRPLLLGPGSIRHAHSDREQITVAELEQAVDRYVELVTLLADREV